VGSNIKNHRQRIYAAKERRYGMSFQEPAQNKLCVSTKGKRFYISKVNAAGSFGIFTIIMENLYTKTYREAIGMHESGMRQGEVLTYLASAAETAAGRGTAASILLLDEQGLLRNGASPQLPSDYLQAIDGLKPDANVGTCAAAAATGNVVMTPSFYADNKWAELRHLPLALGYVAAWSVPIKSKDDKVIGTFGTYFRQCRLPSDEEVTGTKLLATAAAFVLGNEINKEKSGNS